MASKTKGVFGVLIVAAVLALVVYFYLEKIPVASYLGDFAIYFLKELLLPFMVLIGLMNLLWGIAKH